MLTFQGSRRRFCDGVSRRDFLRIGALGAGVTLADVLRARAAAGAGSSPKSAIVIYLPGGPPHMEMYDPKPEAPVEFRGETRAIATNLPGVRIGELLPLHAGLMDKVAVLRSVVAGAGEHSDANVMTGYPEPVTKLQQRPSIGSVVSKVRGGAGDVPPFVSLRPGRPTVGDPFSWGVLPGYLGVAHGAFPAQSQGEGLANLQLPNGLTRARFEDRRTLLGAFDSVRRDIDASGAMQGMDGFARQAFDLVASGKVHQALDLKHEDPATVARYKGVEQFLTARRLVEAGVGCVTFNYGTVNWDTHSNHFPAMPQQLPPYDRGVANLIRDLHDRGMQDDVVVLIWGEFGRTPRINKAAGRDHWPEVMSALIAGGGLKMGQVIGSSTATAEAPKDRPYRVPQVLATVYRVLGIDPATTFPNLSGRPMHVLDERDPVAELL